MNTISDRFGPFLTDLGPPGAEVGAAPLAFRATQTEPHPRTDYLEGFPETESKSHWCAVHVMKVLLDLGGTVNCHSFELNSS